MADNKKSEQKRSFTFFKRLFGNRNELSFAEEEMLQSPGRTIARNFFGNKLGRFGLIVFLCIFLFVFIGPHYMPLDLSANDNTQINVPPTLSMMKVPSELKGHIADITPGTTFGVGVSDTGRSTPGATPASRT